MSIPPRRRRRWLLASTAAAMVAVGLVGAAHLPPTPSPAPEGPTAAPAPPSPGAVAPEGSTFAEQLPLPPGASPEERLRVELTYSLVEIPDDRLADLRAVAAGAIGVQSLDGTTYVSVPADQIEAVRAAFPDSPVTPNQEIATTADQTPTPSWGLDAIDSPDASQDQHYLSDTTGAGTTVYVVDSGIQSTHPDFGGRVDAANGHTEIADGNGTEDCDGHGTHVAGTVGSTTYGVAKATRLVPVRVFDCEGKGTSLAFFYGLLWIFKYHKGTQSVVTMSLGALQNSTIDKFVQAGVDSGFVMISAAGNDADDACKYSPAHAPNGITVGAVERPRKIAWYSNFGSCVTLFAPGSDITSTWIGSTTNTISGTSMATPHVAGLAARLLEEHPTWKPAQVKTALTSTPGATGNITAVPDGTANVFAAIPGVPRVLTVAVTGATSGGTAGGESLSWTVNDIGTITSFTVTVTDTTSGRIYRVDVPGATRSTDFLDVLPGHSYTVGVGASGTLPTGVAVTSDPVTASFTAPA